jgi:hypothetical protein
MNIKLTVDFGFLLLAVISMFSGQFDILHVLLLLALALQVNGPPEILSKTFNFSRKE